MKHKTRTEKSITMSIKVVKWRNVCSINFNDCINTSVFRKKTKYI